MLIKSADDSHRVSAWHLNNIEEIKRSPCYVCGKESVSSISAKLIVSHSPSFNFIIRKFSAVHPPQTYDDGCVLSKKTTPTKRPCVTECWSNTSSRGRRLDSLSPQKSKKRPKFESLCFSSRCICTHLWYRYIYKKNVKYHKKFVFQCQTAKKVKANKSTGNRENKLMMTADENNPVSHFYPSLSTLDLLALSHKR